jgi:secondary thiamine-phosphate synthase enzyme
MDPSPGGSVPNEPNSMSPQHRITHHIDHSMVIYQTILVIGTRGRGLVEVTNEVSDVVRASGVETGLCILFVQHTSASLLIQENADPTVRRDLEDWIEDLAPETRNWCHDDEGPDDMPAHARSAITLTSQTVPVAKGRLALGTWQGLYLWEHRRCGHQRRLVVHVQGEQHA